jgi:hypothetical protein
MLGKYGGGEGDEGGYIVGVVAQQNIEDYFRVV